MQPKKDPNPNAPKEVVKPLNPGTQVARVRYSPDGKALAAACFDGKVRRWDVSAKEPTVVPAISGHNGWVSALAFAGNTLFSADSWGRLTATDVAAKEARQLWSVEESHDGWLRTLAVAPDAPLATCGKDGFVRFWDRDTGKRLSEVGLKSDILSVCFSADGKHLFAGDLFGIVREISVASGKTVRTLEVKELHKLDRIQDVGGVKNLALSADGKTLFVAGAEPKTGGFVQCIPLLIVFDVAIGKRIAQYKGANDNEGYVTDLASHSDGRVIFTTSGQPGQGKFHVWKPGDAATQFSGGKLPNCHSVALSPDGTTIAVSATNANSSGNGRVKGAGGDYPENTSPIQLWSLPRV